MVQASFLFFPLKSFVFPNRIRQSWSGLYTGGLVVCERRLGSCESPEWGDPGDASRPAVPCTPPADFERGRGKERGERAGQWPQQEMGT